MTRISLTDSNIRQNYTTQKIHWSHKNPKTKNRKLDRFGHKALDKQIYITSIKYIYIIDRTNKKVKAGAWVQEDSLELEEGAKRHI